tara:strand:- start:323 stop:559 length:237 start_codon:yes stop_codon:yes gene_type:complete
MWWLGLGVLFFIWFIMNGDEFYYEGLKKGNMNVILLHLLVLFPLGFLIYAFAVVPFIELLWTGVDWSSWGGDDYVDDY